MNGEAVPQPLPGGKYVSISFDGLGGVLPPPMTYMKVGAFGNVQGSARVSPVGLGILGIVMMESAIGS
jgi:hypothetical protein